jgi:hypothetical protein
MRCHSLFCLGAGGVVILEGGLVFHLAAAAKDAAREGGSDDTKDDSGPTIGGKVDEQEAEGAAGVLKVLACGLGIPVVLDVAARVAIGVIAVVANVINEGAAGAHGKEHRHEDGDEANNDPNNGDDLALGLHDTAAQGKGSENDHDETEDNSNDGTNDQIGNEFICVLLAPLLAVPVGVTVCHIDE